MKVSFFFGNGLDMQCNLDTSYYAFFKHILEDKYRIDIETDSKIKIEVNDKDKNRINNIDNLIYKYIVELKENRYKNWADLETNLGELTKKLYNESKNDSKVSSSFLDSLEELRDDLEGFLKIRQASLHQKIDEDFFEILKSTMLNFHSGLKPQKLEEIKDFINLFTDEHIYYNFITLNYTNTLEFILKNSKQEEIYNSLTSSSSYRIVPPKKVIHAHGLIGDALTLGVNDDLQMSCDLFTNDEHIFLIKPKLIEEDGQIMKIEAENVIKESNLIILFGVSLGETDKDWWSFIGNSLLENPKQKLIIHNFEHEASNRTSSVKSVRRRKKVEDNFLKYVIEDKEKKDALRDKIFVLENSNDILNIDLSKYNNIEINEKIIDNVYV